MYFVLVCFEKSEIHTKSRGGYAYSFLGEKSEIHDESQGHSAFRIFQPEHLEIHTASREAHASRVLPFSGRKIENPH